MRHPRSYQQPGPKGGPPCGALCAGIATSSARRTLQAWRGAAFFCATLGTMLLALCAPTPAAAQSAYDIPKHLAMFDRHCRAALQGLDAFKATVSAPGPFGEPVFSVSPDGHFINAKTGIDGFLVSASFQYGPGVVIRFCQVENMEIRGTQRAVTEPAFLALAPKGNGITMTGGPFREELPAVGSFALAGVGNITSVRSLYTFFGATEPAGSWMTAYIGDNIFLLNASAMVAR